MTASSEHLQDSPQVWFSLGKCSLGSILVARSGRGICAIFLGDEPAALIREFQDEFPKANLVSGNAEFERLVTKVIHVVETPALGLDIPLDIRGTDFQMKVWHALQAIPSGATATYAEIAARIGSPGSARAVGRACATNSMAVVIPCHRAVRAGGGLSGYRWGLSRKQALLDREATSAAGLSRAAECQSNR